MKHRTTKVIILKRTNFKEADRILTLLSDEWGKIKVIAKGVRKQKSKLAGGLELLSVSEVSYIIGKSEIYTLTSSRLVKHYQEVVNDIDRTMIAYSLINKVYKLSEDHTGQEFFTLLDQSLVALNDQIDLRLVESWFNIQLLKLTGHTPNLVTDIDNKPLKQGMEYAFDTDKMLFNQNTAGKYSDNHIKLTRLLLKVETCDRLKPLTGLTEYFDLMLRLSKQLVGLNLRLESDN